jgi:HEPN domain-containing protein
MSDYQFNQWEHLPINLAAKQIADPLSVFDDFFSSAWLPEHLKQLHKWREAILAQSFFLDAKGSPIGLLTAYKNNLELVESAYLVNSAYKNGYDRYGTSIATSVEQLIREKDMWPHFPIFLTNAELINPLAVLENFFNAFSLQEYREQLDEWLENGLSNQSADKWMEPSEIIAFYENMQKLYGAAWLILQRLSDDPYLSEATETGQAISKSVAQGHEPTLYKLNTLITLDQQEQITQMVSIIKDKVPTIEAVIYLGACPDEQDIMFLLVLTDNNEQGLAQDISNHLEECCKTIANVVILVHHAASLMTATDEKNFFLKKAASCPVIYVSGGLILPRQRETDYSLISEIALRKWQRWHSQSTEFLKGAEYYLSIGAHNAALFSLSQTAECLLVAIIRFVTGYDINTHNLERLLKLTQMFTGDIASVFGLENEENKKLFKVLKGAYVDVRYRDRYQIDPVVVPDLYELVKKMVGVIDEVCDKHVLTSTL